MMLASLISAVLWTQAAAFGLQPGSQTAEELVASLTERKPVCAISAGAFRERHRAFELIAKGPAALPLLEEAMDQMEDGREYGMSCGIEWLLYAYARMRGPAAYPRLKHALTNQRSKYLHREIEVAIAVSLGLTSVITSLDQAVALYGIGQQRDSFGFAMPQYSLDSLLLGFLTDSRESAAELLGPSAADAFHRWSAGRDWQSLRAEFLRGSSSAPYLIEYKLSLPEGMVSPLQPDRLDFEFDEPSQRRLAGTVEFFRGGTKCGSHRVEFADVSDPQPENRPRSWRFLLDNQDLEALLRSAGKCIQQP